MQAQQHFTEAYARLAPIYSWIYGHILEPGRATMGIELRKLRPRRLLEVGVGTGLALRRYPAEAEIHGIDVCPQMLVRAQRNARQLAGRSIHLHLMDAEYLSFPDNSFDCVTLPYVLSVTRDPLRLISEARRVCTPNGTLLVLNHFSEGGFWQQLEWLGDAVRTAAGFNARFDYQQVIASHDWRVVKKVGVNFLGLSRFLVIENAQC